MRQAPVIEDLPFDVLVQEDICNSTQFPAQWDMAGTPIDSAKESSEHRNEIHLCYAERI